MTILKKILVLNKNLENLKIVFASPLPWRKAHLTDLSNENEAID